MGKCATELKDMENKLSFRARLALIIYRVLYFLLMIPILCVAPILGKFSRRVKEGFNDYLGNVKLPKSFNKPVLWVHGVSMGESMVALGFAKELRNLYPNSTILFTTTHPDVVKNVKNKEFIDAVAYFPLDNYRSMKRIFNRWKPDCIFVSETDFWPEFSNCCRQRNIPLVLINGRISSKIASFYSKVDDISEIVFGAFSFFAVQSRADADRLIELKVPLDKINILGNMKADFTHTNQVDLNNVSSWLNNRKSVVFGSLHPEEFSLLFPLFKKLVENNIAVIIAPRNIGFANDWKDELTKAELKVCCKSQIENSDIMLLDTIGELASVYKLSSVSFVGGSLDNNKTGAHNPLEVLQQGVPLVIGSYYRNFADIVEQLKEVEAVSVVENDTQAYEEIMKIINDNSLAEKMVKAGNEVLESNKGVLDETIKMASKLINGIITDSNS